ncbi:MAG TPA: hypothetical protein PLV21_15220 [Cyclobacteriaceae bacterium]|nr:hypothetical protein [Cyclobacteriaceae bacterium]HRJ83237.1 hypothetical protein [Cyclobacteriaceae bacterium]
MRNTILLLLFLQLNLPLIAQQSVPVFANKKDSIDHAQVQKAIQEIFSRNQLNGEEKKSLDSLLALSNLLRAKVIGFKVIYKPKESFTSYEELASGNVKPEEVTQLQLAEVLRKKGTIVHLNTLEKEVDPPSQN